MARKSRDFLGERPYGLAAGLYIVVLGAGWMLGCFDSGPYVAARELKHNHRVTIGDVRRQNEFAASLGFYTVPPASFAGKYIKAEPSLAVGSQLSEQIAEWPTFDVSPKQHALPFQLPANSPMLALLNVGSEVVLVSKDKKATVPVPATVLTIVCQLGKSEAEGCYPVLQIDENRTQDVLQDPSMQLLLSSKR
ncbi:hypothetical protein [Reyranella sp.]|uniref:hypothetical protein n=1 Tax=Reyranella sp. TaxID=1929291 RepID=UPI003D115A44